MARRRNPLTSESYLMLLVGAVGGAMAYSWYKNQQQAQALAAANANPNNPLYTSTSTTSLPAPQTGAQSGYAGGQG